MQGLHHADEAIEKVRQFESNLKGGNKPPLYRIAVIVQTGTEQVQADMPSWNPVTGEQLNISPSEMKVHINELLSALDDRKFDAQKRMLASYGLLKFLPPEYQQMVLEIIECLTGQADPAMVVKRWEAIAEENAALAEGRLAAIRNGVND